MQRPKQHRRKWDRVRESGVLVGYSETSKAYRILIADKDVREERNVKVFELAVKRTCLSGDDRDDDRSYIEVPVNNPSVEESVQEELSEQEVSDDELMFFSSSDQEDEVYGEEQQQHESVALPRRSERTRNPVIRPDFAYLCDITQPATYQEAKRSIEKDQWQAAMDKEISSLLKYETWELVQRPERARVIKNRWVFQRKESTEEAKFKARLVVKGYMQDTTGVELFSPVVRYETIRAALSVASQKRMKLAKFDVSTAFLNGKLKEVVYMEQPEGYDDGTGRVCRLIKSLYGLKQSPRCWGDEMSKFLEGQGFISGEADVCLYVKRKGKDIVIVLMYVDDGLVLSTNESLTAEILRALKQRFEITVQMEVNSFLGLEIRETSKGIMIGQGSFVDKLVSKFRLDDAQIVDTPIPNGWKPVDSAGFKNNTLYREIVGQLMY